MQVALSGQIGLRESLLIYISPIMRKNNAKSLEIFGNVLNFV